MERSVKLKAFILFACCLWIGLVRPVFSLDEDEAQGPGGFYYLQYEQEPWRLPESIGQLERKSDELFVAGLLVSGYLWLRKRKLSRQ